MKKGKTSEPGLLASDSDWHNNACLNYMPDHGTAYTEGYRRAADILINHIDESGRDQIFWFIRCCFSTGITSNSLSNKLLGWLWH